MTSCPLQKSLLLTNSTKLTFFQNCRYVCLLHTLMNSNEEKNNRFVRAWKMSELEHDSNVITTSLYFISYTFLPSSNSGAAAAPNDPFGSPAHQTGFVLASVIGCCVQSCSRHFGKSFQHLISHILQEKKHLSLSGCQPPCQCHTDSVHAPLMCLSSPINFRASIYAKEVRRT